jgi:hypothetical protein
MATMSPRRLSWLGCCRAVRAFLTCRREDCAQFAQRQSSVDYETRAGGGEPTRPCGHQILSLARLSSSSAKNLPRKDYSPLSQIAANPVSKPLRGQCSGRDLNPHGLRHTPLKRTCLPIPPPERLYSGGRSSRGRSRRKKRKILNAEGGAARPLSGLLVARPFSCCRLSRTPPPRSGTPPPRRNYSPSNSRRRHSMTKP